MTITGPPYFMTKKDWYTFDEKKWRLVLTDNAPPEAVASYNKFYKELKRAGWPDKRLSHEHLDD